MENQIIEQAYEGKENLNEPLYSLNHLNLISNGKKEFVDKMVALFINDMPKQLLDLSNAYKNNDVVAFSMCLHKLKPSLAHFEIHSVSAMAPQINLWCKNSLPPLSCASMT